MQFVTSHYYRCPVCYFHVEWTVERNDGAATYRVRCGKNGCILWRDEKTGPTMQNVIEQMDRQGGLQNK